MAISSIFERDEFKPLAGAWRNRVNELARRKSYYDGSVYRRMRSQLDWLAPRLYGGIKPLYLPLSRAVDVDAGIVPGGWAFPKGAPGGWAKARQEVFGWSSWSTGGVLLVHYGAQYGLSGLKVSDLRDIKQIVIAPLDPMTFLLLSNTEYSGGASAALIVEGRADSGGGFEYAEVIEPDRVRTFRDGTPYGYDARDAEYRNELGFVPVVEVRHIETGERLGECTYQKALPLLDEVNELASYLADIIKKHAEPQWAIFGSEPSELTKSGDNVWFIPSGGDVKPVVAGIDIDGVLDFVREIRDQVHGALPELAFDELRKKDQIATATLELQLMELVLKIKRVRPNYDAGLIAALRMAGRAAATMRLSEIAVLDDDALAFDEERSVLPLDPETHMRLELQALALERERALMIGEGGR